MTVGNQATQAGINNNLTSYAIQLRNLMRQLAQQQELVVGLGLTGLQALGFGSAANPANPGGVSDSQYVLNLFSFMNTVAGVYLGTATQASLFNFDNALSPLWAAD